MSLRIFGNLISSCSGVLLFLDWYHASERAQRIPKWRASLAYGNDGINEVAEMCEK